MTAIAAPLRPSGRVRMSVIRRDPFGGRDAAHPLNVLRHGLPRPGLATEINVWRIRNLPNLFRGLAQLWIALALGIPTHYGAVFLRKIGPDGRIIEYGLGSLRVVTTAGVTEICTRFAGTSAASIANFKYHGFGTGTTAEAIGDTALVTELTTEYAVDSTRPTGSQAASTNTYTTVGTLSPDSGGTLAITEHGIFSATSAGTLLDRSKFTAVNLVASSDSLQVTYTLTVSAGG
jgi:hypothetical protein